ncbi:MAG: carbon-nitrogen hydrolase, partial [Bacteroidota bacterium]
MKIETRALRMTDYESLKESMQKAYHNWQTAYWKESHIQKLLNIFPEGQLCVTIDDMVAGCALSIIVNYDDFGDEHTYAE